MFSSTVTSVLCVAALALPFAQSACNEVTNWCDFGPNMAAHYKCDTPTDCLTSKVGLQSDHSKFVEIMYSLPALKDGAGADLVEFEVSDFSGFVQDQNADAEKAYFAIATPLMINGGVTPVGYLAVLQGIAFTNFTLSSIPTPAVPGVGVLYPCLAGMNQDGSCVSKNFEEGQFKWSFAAYQVEDCANPSECVFYMRTKLDTSALGDDAYVSIVASDSKTYSLTNPPATDVSISKIVIGDFGFTFPTGVNTNNDIYDEDGTKIYVEAIDGKTINLQFAVKAPGAGKFVSYDPTVDFSQHLGAASASSACASVVVGLLAALALFN